MSAESEVATNIKSSYIGGGQPGVWKLVDADGNVILEMDLDNATLSIGGDDNVLIDGANKRIIINDGTDDRVLIGYASGGF